MTNVDLEPKSLAPIAVEILFCLGFESLSLTKRLAKKIATESGIKLLIKIDFGETVLSLKYYAIKNPKILRLRVLIFHCTVILRVYQTTKPRLCKRQSYRCMLIVFEHCFDVFLLVELDFQVQI